MQETDLEIVALYPQYSRGFIYGPPPPKKKKQCFLVRFFYQCLQTYSCKYAKKETILRSPKEVGPILHHHSFETQKKDSTP